MVLHPDRSPTLALTAGEPAGIGSELIARLAATPLAANLVAIGDRTLIEAGARVAGINLVVSDYRPSDTSAVRQPG